MTPHNVLDVFDFQLPSELEATEPPEVRGLTRDSVRLMVSHYETDAVAHSQFKDISDYLEPGDVVVLNTSGTMKAALHALRADGTRLNLHVSTRLPDGNWVVELRQLKGQKTSPFLHAQAGEIIKLPAGHRARLIAPYDGYQGNELVRLWIACIDHPRLHEYLDKYGYPIRYNYVQHSYPIEYYQTVYATENGSAEMPSAGRPFTAEIITALVAKGVQVAPLILHTGVASQEADEPPYAEYYRISAATADLVNVAHQTGRRVIAIGTTVVRALETAFSADDGVAVGEGWTELVITPERGVHVVDGMLTGFHEPRASHLAMLQALAGQQHIQFSYEAALQQCYHWHEFGDVHLILP